MYCLTSLCNTVLCGSLPHITTCNANCLSHLYLNYLCKCRLFFFNHKFKRIFFCILFEIKPNLDLNSKHFYYCRMIFYKNNTIQCFYQSGNTSLKTLTIDAIDSLPTEILKISGLIPFSRSNTTPSSD